MSKVTACMVGTLMGDAWMCLPAVIELCRHHEVDLVCGSYALPMWEWGVKHAVGAEYKIVRVISDPDEVTAEFCPGFGFISIDKALKKVQAEMPGETVLGHNDIGSAYRYAASTAPPLPAIETHGIDVCDGDAVVIHPYTRHDWKNCQMVIGDVNFTRPVKVVGIPGEFARPGWESVSGFDNMVAELLRSAGFVGILSSFTNVAALFQKKQIIVSFTPDVPILNPRARILIDPTRETLQGACMEAGL